MADDVLPIWSVHDVFVQANVVHGYRYLDLSGVVLNTLSDRYKAVNVITPSGTSLSNPVDAKDPLEVQFGSARIRLHYTGIDAVQKVEGTAPEMMKSIAEKLEMKEFSRYGVRVSYFIATKNVLKAGDVVTRKLVSDHIAEVVANQKSDVQTSLQIPLVFKNMEVFSGFVGLLSRVPLSILWIILGTV